MGHAPLRSACFFQQIEHNTPKMKKTPQNLTCGNLKMPVSGGLALPFIAPDYWGYIAIYVTALVLLDLSAAFDTLYHSSIIDLLSGRYGIFGTALNWVCSYLSDRVQMVKPLNKLGEPCPPGLCPETTLDRHLCRAS